MQHRHLRALFHRLSQARRQQRMILAQERADHEHFLQLTERRNRHPEPRPDLAIERKIGLPQAEIDMVRPESAHQFIQQREFFQRRMRRCQRGDRIRAMFFFDIVERMRNVFERSRPVGFMPLVILLDHRPGQPFGAI